MLEVTGSAMDTQRTRNKKPVRASGSDFPHTLGSHALLFFTFQTCRSSIDLLIEAAAALTVVFNPEPDLLVCVRGTQSPRRLPTHSRIHQAKLILALFPPRADRRAHGRRSPTGGFPLFRTGQRKRSQFRRGPQNGGSSSCVQVWGGGGGGTKPGGREGNKTF